MQNLHVFYSINSAHSQATANAKETRELEVELRTVQECFYDIIDGVFYTQRKLKVSHSFLHDSGEGMATSSSIYRLVTESRSFIN